VKKKQHMAIVVCQHCA